MKALLVTWVDTVLFLFWQVYPDCLSQVIYVTFCEAFPESIKNFDDDFKDGLVDLIFQWISGTGSCSFVFYFFMRHILSRPPDVHFSENLMLFSLVMIYIYRKFSTGNTIVKAASLCSGDNVDNSTDNNIFILIIIGI